MKSLLKRILFYIQYPNQLYAYLFSLTKQNKARKMGILKVSPNYIFFENFTENSVIIDVGCGYNAELSQYLINKYKLTAYAVDPTEKHAPALKDLVDRYSPHFIHLPYAVVSKNDEIDFFETLDHESGSLLNDHCNIVKDRIRKYTVQGKNISTLIQGIGTDKVELLKLDLEGAEYELIDHLTAEELAPVRQLFIEFHHHAFRRIHRRDTIKAVSVIKSLGFKAFTLDSNNYLFYRS
ncbi:MAG: FkbM family methyltransferase [Bacteroidales bacterium]|nr:FkbM family methyltransferase [Bacteroidales bacterium]